MTLFFQILIVMYLKLLLAYIEVEMHYLNVFM